MKNGINKESLGASVNVSIGSSKMTSEQTVHTETVNTSNINAGGNVVIKGTEEDVTLKGTKINAKDITLDAAKDITLGSGENKQETDSKTSSSSWSLGGSIGANAGYFGNVSKGSGKEHENATTHTGSTLDASGTLTLKSGEDTNIKGSQAKGEKVVADIKGNLNIASQQDTDDYTAKNKNSGIGFSTGAKGGMTGSIGKGKTDSTYTSVTEQAGIVAGKDGFDIHVGKNTDLKGAVIASDATPDKNILSTDTLTYSDIQNQAEYSASSIGVNLDTRKGTEKKDQGLTPNIGGTASGDADSTTKSAVSPGTIEVRSNPNQDVSNLSRDTNNSLNVLGKIFDKKTVQEQQELAKVFGEEVFKAVGNLKLKEGSSEKAAIDFFVGGLMAKLGGGDFLSGAASAGITQLVMKELANIKDPAILQWASAVVGAAAAKVVGGNVQTGASVAASETKNNYLSHEQQRQKLEELAKCKTKEERKAVEEKWDELSDEQMGNPNIEAPGTVVYDKKNNKVYFSDSSLEGHEVTAQKPIDYGSLFDKIKGNIQSTGIYAFYKQELMPIGQGLGSSAIANMSWSTVQINMADGSNPRMYYVGKTLGDVAFVVGGTLITITGAGGTIVVSPTGVGAIAGSTVTAYAAGATANGAYNFSEDFSRIFSSNGASTEGPSKAAGFEKNISKMPPGERVATVKTEAAKVAEQNGWVKDRTYSKMNDREVYKDPKTGQLYSVDTQHGRFEKCNSKGKHQGEVNLDLEQTKPADSSGKHDLRVK